MLFDRRADPDPEGEVFAGDLQIGDMIVTRDRGAQPLLWVAKREVPGAEIAANPNLAPVEIAVDSFGFDLPRQTLNPSPHHHRVLVRSPIVKRLCGHPDALVPIKHLCSYPGIAAAPDVESSAYVHLSRNSMRSSKPTACPSKPSIRG